MRRRSALVVGMATAAMLTMATVGPLSSGLADAPPASGVSAADTGTKTVVESSTGSYIVVMKQDPLVATIPSADLDTAAAKAQGDALDATHAEVLSDAGVAADAKVQDYQNALNGFSAMISHDQAVALAANPKVSMVLPDELHQVTKDNSGSSDDGSASGRSNDALGDFIGLTGKGEAWRSGLTGEGVVVGVIDTGIWPEHPSFADDGTFPAAPPLDTTERSACDFGNTAHNANDAAFTCNNKLIGARSMLDTYRHFVGMGPDEFDSARDDEGHGTHTASTAAGDAKVQAAIFGRNLGKISGVAPRAQIIAYKALGAGGGFGSDLAAAIDQAVADGVDVINYSVGGGANLAGADAIAFLFAARAGVFTAVSAGNSGPGEATIGGPADVPWVTAVGANTMSRFYQGAIRLDGGPTITGASLTKGTKKLQLVDAEFAGTSDLCLDGTLDPAKVAGKIVLCRRGGNGRIAKSAEVLRAGGAGMILYNVTDDDNLFSDNFFVPTVHVDNTPGLKVKAYIKNHQNPKGTIYTGRVTDLRTAPSMTIFSSRGPNPTASDIIKPDITAPGIQILAGNTPFPTPGSQPAGELFQAIAGTSMSSPVTAGVYALLKQAHPEWTAAEAKSALMTTAFTKVHDNDEKTQAGPFAMGSGMVNPGKVARKGSSFNPGLVYDTTFNDYLGFMCDQAPEIFGNPAATCASLAAAGIPTVATDLNYPSIGISGLAGSATVTRTVTSVADTAVSWKVSVKAPAGYQVKVFPSTLTLQPGASASYQVTVTNTGTGTPGEWRTGELTWTGGGEDYYYGSYKVRSPIAVRGLALSAPDEVSGTGVAGTAAFDVKFGYTGAYTALAHGLVGSVDTTGDISQDPDQTFPSADDGVGVDAIPVTLTGAAHVRWTLNIPGPDDLDLYLLDSTGTVIAQSTNGGTDEQIDLVTPADGNYTLVVHGWQVPSQPLAYTVHNWVVPLTPGGSLVVDSAPTSAVVGATGTVSISWSGLTAGSTYLGAVSHRDATGIIGLTLVDVTG